MIAAAQRARQVSSRLEYRFVRPEVEPLLWLPDVVAGAVTRSVGDGDPGFLDLLGDAVATIAL